MVPGAVAFKSNWHGIDDRQSPNTEHRSPITNHQSPIANRQSPIANRQSAITYRLPGKNCFSGL